MTSAKFLRELGQKLDEYNPRSCWLKGVKEYASEIVERLHESSYYLYDDFFYSTLRFEKACLDGATDWDCYSWGGCSLIYNRDIAERLCNSSELKRTDYGRTDPNKCEQWLDVQTRALCQAFNLLDSYRMQIIKGSR